MKRIYRTFFRITIWILLTSPISINAQVFPVKCGHQKRQLNPNNLLAAANNRSDTIDVLKYTISLDITDFINQKISGNCTVLFTPKINSINSISLDLLQLNIDSITSNNSALSYSYNDTLIIINLGQNISNTDTIALTVYYNGSPQPDASGWGGWYWQGNYAYNLGVGFDANPHNYGRVWFPCFDNFVERSTYEFFITTSGGKTASCNGTFAGQTTVSGDTIESHWLLDDEIPTYLACVAVGPYVTVIQTHSGTNGPIPIELFAQASDTNNLKASFANLGPCISTFENNYGPYEWEKVGYSLVPFSSGAMEHATNIAYPRVAANGTLTSETLMAHEFAHHWWGNLVTCKTAADMWINEGMATYSEALFLESLYGQEAYLEEIANTQKAVLHYTHHREGGYRAISGVPHEYVYSEHVYNKGALVAHTLRGYLGDSLFFSGLQNFLTNNKFSDVDSYQLRDQLTLATGVDLTDFFEDWVFNPGFPHFSIDSFNVSGTGPYTVDVFIKQKLTGAPTYFKNIPLEITFIDSNWNESTHSLTATGTTTTITTLTNILPVMAILNRDPKIADAVTSDERTLTSTGIYALNQALMTVTVNSITDSAFLRVEHHWTAPDPIQNLDSLKMELSPNRYWTVDGILPTDFSATARIIYNGKTTGTGFLDIELVAITEDSLRLLYRENESKDWREYEFYTKNTLGSALNQYGIIDIDSLVLGEYCLANTKHNVGIKETPFNSGFSLFPNPVKNQLTISPKEPLTGKNHLIITDVSGKRMYQNLITSSVTVNTGKWKSGNYIANIISKTGNYSKKFVVVN